MLEFNDNHQPTAFADIKEAFDVLADWEDRYRYLIDMGRNLEPLDDPYKAEENLIHGCQSQVWILHEVGEDGKFRFRGESDAIIVNGLISMLLSLYWGKTAAEILEIDAKSELEPLQLDHHLTSSRRNGLFSMAQKVREWAENVA
ncbi:MAG: SufE family protein [Verrucomicrobiota bacterium]